LLIGGAALAAYTLGLRSSLDTDFRMAMALVIAGIGAALLLFGRNSAALAAAICLLLSVPILLQLPREMAKGNWPALLALAFPVVGLGLAATSTLAALRDRKYGARLEPSDASGTVGGRLTARIVTRTSFPSGTAVSLTLSCVRSYVSSQDRHRTRWQRVLWQDTLSATASGVEIPVAFTIPADVRETDSADPDDEILWRLSAEAETPGLDFRARFPILVRRTSQTDESLTVARLDRERQDRAAGVPGTEFYLPPARHKTVAAALTAFGLAALAVGIFFGAIVNHLLGWIGALLPIVVIGGLGAGLLLLASSLWFTSTRIDLGNRELHVKSSWLGISRSKVLRAGDVEKLEMVSGMQQGEKVWYDIRLYRKVGGRVTAGSGMERGEADWLAKEIRRELEVPE
jgi:hypothetical protein